MQAHKSQALFPFDNKRRSGILLHISSLPGRYGIGQLGKNAWWFMNFLKEAGQSVWQFLPLGPTKTELNHSPYMSSSAFAGNPLFICPEALAETGFLKKDDLKIIPDFNEYLVEFEKVEPFILKLIQKAYLNFLSTSKPASFAYFCDNNKNWLTDYCMFMALKERFKQRPWNKWPRELATRQPDALKKARKALSDSIQFYSFAQWIFFLQWQELKKKGTGFGY